MLLACLTNSRITQRSIDFIIVFKMVDPNCNEETLPLVFYTYDEEMMKHKDEDRHDADGKKKQLVEGDELMAPEVPFRIKSIYEYLRTYPEEDSLLSQM